MKCPKCGYDNKADAKFCNECGNKLELICPECRKTNTSGSKFCNQCGTRFSRSQAPDLTPLDEKIDKIQRYLPAGLTEKILAQRDRIEGEKKQVTVLFCDLVGYTKMAGKLDPEETYALMDQVMELLIHKVHDYGGTVNQLLGDGLYALFGAPVALEDGPQRAIRSAIEMHKAIKKLSDKINKEKDISPLVLRIGINSGPVVLGTIGNSLRVEFTAVGETVNLASRMESLANPGTTFVTEETFKRTAVFFRFEAQGKKEVKGKDEPIEVFEVIAPSNRSTHFDVSAERGLIPLVGRERELEILLDGFETVKSGRGQAFSIVAEAGAGKSRLLYEFRKAIASEEVTILEGKCLSFARNVAYRPIIDILKANFRIEDDDEDGIIQEKVVNELQAIKADEASTLPYLLDLLSVKESGIKQLNITPELIKDRIGESLQRIVIKGSELGPLIMIFEDLHWIDSPTEYLLKELLESIPGSKVLLLFSYRTEYVHTWGGKSYHSQVTLNRLSNRESLSMLYHILDTRDINRDLEELVLDKAEGIPFYLEEFVKSLKDLNIIEKKDKYRLVKDIKDLTIPSSIQDVIMAKVDALPEGAREVLQIGSIIEREFSFELIGKIIGQAEDDLLANLSILKDSELLYERGIYPDMSYIFKHALAREVVYDSILGKKRKKLHNLTGTAIEELHQGQIEEHFEILAEHYLAGENYEKGAECAKLAARKAAKSAFYLNAIEYDRKQVFCIEKLPQTNLTRVEKIKIKTRLAIFYGQINHFIAAKDVITAVVDDAEKLKLRKYLPYIYNTFGNYYCAIEEDYEKGVCYFENALQMAEEEKDFMAIAAICLHFGGNICSIGEYEKALVLFKKALELSKAGNVFSLVSQIKVSISNFIYLRQGKIDLAYQLSEESLSLALEQDDLTKGYVFLLHGQNCFHKGAINESEEYLIQGLALAEKCGLFTSIAFVVFTLGEIFLMKREYKKSESLFEKLIQAVRHVKSPSGVLLSQISMVRYRILSGQTADTSELFESMKKIKIKILKSLASVYISEIFLKIDDQHMPEAEEWLNRAIEINTQNGTRFWLGQSYHLYSEFFKCQNNLPQAREQINKAIDILKECGADGWVERYQKELVDLH